MKCLCASTRHAARLLMRYYEEELRSTQLTPAQFELMGTLLARPGLSQTDLATALSVDQTTLSRNLKILISRKWIRGEKSTKDRRQSTYELDKEGKKAWERALPHWQRAHSHMQEALGSHWQEVWSALEQLTRAVPL